ncbi:valyl-tRNA synthetase [Sulfurifustis variabilis]|uniref:Valine--tRNA ligase n=2 Tax=Sulfurifustis variabilis TaxID=1675686 RepID=A0A1B4VDB7_9GAMM|nr:valyl-tRNA synthetase [Sulfurifustis variabilis]
MIPPPNVTGSLHMGHAFQDTLMDTLTRFHRMSGERALWQAGTDHAGIATQMVVERQLEAEGKTRHDLGRDKFIERVWEWKAQSGGRITKQLRRLGASLDWSRERFTMDEGLSRAVAEVFVRLYEEGLIYRGKRLVNWDPVLHTAVSDLEVVSEEENGSLWHIRYPLAEAARGRASAAGGKTPGTSGAGHLVVATTRPETLLGDAAVAVHPNDDRYKHLIGALVELPLTGRRIPIIADEYVDPAFGTGCVKITPAHDFNDYQVWLRHRDETPLRNVPQNGLINIFTPDARLKSDARDDQTWGHRAPDRAGTPHADGEAPWESTAALIPFPYRGLDRFECRKQLVADLDAAGLLEKTEAHKLMVPRGDRTNAVIEPYLTDQWYVKVGPLAEEAIRAVEDGRIRFVPDAWAKTYFEWMRNIQDWCISRQIWWGHRIPAWYDDQGACYVGRSESEVRARHRLGREIALRQDPDVLDTWFSSALWPFSTLGWPEKTRELETFYPTNVLVTGFDIIFFWVARMIMMGLKFMDDVPFREVYITGLIRDAHGQKMSKSKGNILDPLDLIDGIDLESLLAKRTTGLMQPQMARRIEQATRKEYPNGIPAFGTDALRFTMASLATQGRDIKFDLGRIEGYRNFCNKLWNAARYVLMNTEGQDCGQRGGKLSLNHVDRWILGRLQQLTAEVRKNLSEYRFDLAAQALYSFTWYEYCDWYLELSKVVLTDRAGPADAQRGTRHTLVHVLESLLRLLHPIMPFITEEIWLRVAPLAGKAGPSIMREPYPMADESRIDAAAIEELGWVMAVIGAVRTVRSERDIAPSKPLPVLLAEGEARERAWMEKNAAYLKLLGRMEPLTWLDRAEAAPEAVMQLVGRMKVLVPLGSLIDRAAELERLEKEIDKAEKELAKARSSLENEAFVARAPKQVVEQMQQRARHFEATLADLESQQEKVKALPG